MDNMLPERQVFEVIRIKDNCFLSVHYTMKRAMIDLADFEMDYDETCRIGRSYISGEETVAQRRLNEQE